MSPVIEELLVPHILLSAILTVITAGLLLYITIAQNRKKGGKESSETK